MVLTADKAVVPEGAGNVVWRFVFVVAEAAMPAREATRSTLECIANGKQGLLEREQMAFQF
jgi:hypothetical protein